MALTDKLVAIGDAIREKTGTTDPIALVDMPAVILGIETGGGSGGGGVELPDEAFNYTGWMAFTFGYDHFSWFINQFGNKITTSNIGSCASMFVGSTKIQSIPFDINISQDCGTFSGMFGGCSRLEAAPRIYGTLKNMTGPYSGTRVSVDTMFSGCNRIREIPEDYFSSFAGAEYWESASNYSSPRQQLFMACNSLRKAPDLRVLKHNPSGYWESLYYQNFSGCYALDEVINYPVLNKTTLSGSNFFYDTFKECDRLKNMTFELQDDGTPYTVNWSGQTIDLKDAGFCNSSSIFYWQRCTQHNSGITKDKFISSDELYQALKDDPDAYAAQNEQWSRYNHDSAVATINSLPDSSAFGTNTIKFTGVAGSATDGGAINTLTDAEIAVAAAKGWTVTLV